MKKNFCLLLFLMLALCTLTGMCPVPTPAPSEAGESASAAALPDGVYAPGAFSFSGGAGKDSISCPEVTVTGGEAVATLVFSSPSYGYVKTGSRTIYGEHTADTSTFRVPVELDANNRILGMTADREIAYTIYIRISGPQGMASCEIDPPSESAGITAALADANGHA